MLCAFGLLTLSVLAFAALGAWSHLRGKAAPGIAGGLLSACGKAPNCVCSEDPTDTAHYVAPLAMPMRPDGTPAWTAVEAAVRDLGGTIAGRQSDYLHATFVSRVFRFVDDLELRRAGDRLHVRSASRVGHSDLGTNRRRVERLQGALLRE